MESEINLFTGALTSLVLLGLALTPLLGLGVCLGWRHWERRWAWLMLGLWVGLVVGPFAGLALLMLLVTPVMLCLELLPGEPRVRWLWLILLAGGVGVLCVRQLRGLPVPRQWRGNLARAIAGAGVFTGVAVLELLLWGRRALSEWIEMPHQATIAGAPFLYAVHPVSLGVFLLTFAAVLWLALKPGLQEWWCAVEGELPGGRRRGFVFLALLGLTLSSAWLMVHRQMQQVLKFLAYGKIIRGDFPFPYEESPAYLAVDCLDLVAVLALVLWLFQMLWDGLVRPRSSSVAPR
ncbi:MAG: hypothetical protein HY320_12855 [Armatimonadetes bacterium]|nr:hypothetical protein [Armatimonadota bacterium]